MNARRWGYVLYGLGIAILVVGPIVVVKADLHPGHAIPIGAVVLCLAGVWVSHRGPETRTQGHDERANDSNSPTDGG